MTPSPTDTPPEVYTVWIDVETDDLDEQTCNLLEVGIVLTDRHHVEIARRSWVLRYAGTPPDPYVCDMHTRSGLLAECLASPLTREGAEEEIVTWLLAHEASAIVVDEDRVIVTHSDGRIATRSQYLGGRNAHFDRRWLRAHLPRVVALLSHRGLDATTMRVEMAEVGITVAKGEAHRALADLDNDLVITRRHRQALRDGVDGRALAASLPKCDECRGVAMRMRIGNDGQGPYYGCAVHGSEWGWEPVPWDAEAVARLLTPLPDGAG